MGNTKHEAVVATLGLTNEATIAEIAALRDRMPGGRQMLVGPLDYFNGVVSFALLPDGSNEGREPSDEMDQIRAEFIDILKRTPRARWAHVVLYDEMVMDGLRPKIVASSS